MALTIENAELEAQVRAYAEAQGVSPEEYLQQLIAENAWGNHSFSALEEDNATEAEEIRAALAESEEQISRGETIPAGQVFAELRAKHGLPN